MRLPQHLVDDPCMIFFTGATGVFGYSGLTKQDHNKLLFWSVYQTELPHRDAKHDRAALTAMLRERHGDWSDPIIGRCLKEADIDTIYPIFIMPDLPQWGHDGCVLIGDAAHALPPRTGQGSSQAFEDALTLALLLEHYLEICSLENAVSQVIEGLYDIRHPRTKRLKEKALMFPDPKMPMSFMMKWVLWTILFVVTKLMYLTSWVAIVDKWRAEDIVKNYLDKTSSNL
jgi:2-polyprenyl-6-methoxyphenol hydroxylase-like FAD-dependent oxidoreductase